jgi:hypothetical protein
MTCLDNIIKLSRTTCECFDAPEGYNVGQSEIYLDELEGISLGGLSGTENCEQGDIWAMLDRARTNAILQFKSDLLSCIGSNFRPRRNDYKGLIGETNFNASLSILNTYAGVALRPYEIVGGYFELKRIGLMFNVTGPITVKVYSNESTTEIASYSMTTAANALQYVTLEEPLKLPLFSNLVSNLEYFIVYELDGSFQPKNNKSDCGCGKQNTAVSFKNWLTIHGIKGDSVSSLSNFQTSKELNGLVLDGVFTCDKTRLICSDEYPLDFENDERAMDYAYAIRYKAGMLLVQLILDSSNINRYTIMGREALYGKRAHYEKKYQEYVAYLCENTEIVNTDCLVCRPNPNYQIGNILL